MSEWTKERIKQTLSLFGERRNSAYIVMGSWIQDVLSDVERLQSEVATLRSQQAELIEAGNYISGCLRSYVGTLDDDWVILVKELTGGTDAHND